MSAAMAITPSAIRMTIRRSMAPSSYRLGLWGRPGGHRLSGSYPGRTEANSGSAVSGPAASCLDGALPGQPGLAAEPGLVLAPALLLGLGQHGRNLSRPTLPVEGHEHQVRAGGVDGPARGDRLRLDPNPDLHRGSERLVDHGSHRYQIAEVHRLQERHLVHLRGDREAAAVLGRGQPGSRV